MDGRWPPPNCSSPPAGAPTSRVSASRRVGIDDTQPFVPVGTDLRAGDDLWAVGDLTGKGAFTHVGMYQARIATADILGQPHEPADYRALPRVTFTDPEVGAVGMTTQVARDAGVHVRVGTTQVPRHGEGLAPQSRQRRVHRARRGRRPRRACRRHRRRTLTVARCSACSPSPCTPTSPSSACGR